MFDFITFLLGVLFGTFGPAIVLALLIALPSSKENDHEQR